MFYDAPGSAHPIFQTDPYGRQDREIAGSHPVLFRRRRQDEEGPGPDDEPPPPPPPPAISAPDLAMQFRPCLEDLQGPDAPNLEEAVLNAIREEVGAQADVRYACQDGTGRIGVWMRPAASPDVEQARERGLAAFDMLLDREQFATFINAGFVKRIANEAWNEAPKRTDHDGRPQEDGPVHLTGFRVDFVNPDRVVTTISGFDETPLPDVPFDLIITDNFRATGGAIALESATDLDADRSRINALAGLFALASVLVNPIFALIAAGFATESLIIGSLDPADDSAGAGAVVAAQIPTEVYIEGGVKLVPIYDRVTVSSAGLVAAGIVDVVPRDPLVSVIGPRQVAASAGARAVTKSYRAHHVDLREPVRYAWTGGGHPANAGARVTAITFDLEGLEVGGSVQREVRVTATDDDGLTGEAALFVRIFMTDPDDETLPAICRVRPWLPQCQPGNG